MLAWRYYMRFIVNSSGIPSVAKVLCSVAFLAFIGAFWRRAGSFASVPPVSGLEQEIGNFLLFFDLAAESAM
jgi:hypothetical protein